jgi:hypothetical protein
VNILTFSDRLFWLAAREGKITGSRLDKVVTLRGNGKKIGYYEVIAERLGVPADGENPMERGARLEKDALTRFEEETGKKVDGSLIIWEREDNPAIAVSPDGVVMAKAKKDENTEACEAKCLSSARHIEAFLTQKVPDEYYFQCMQYFIVNDKLKKLNFICFDPRFAMFKDPKDPSGKLDFFVIELTRESFLEEEKKGEPKVDQIKKYLDYQTKMLVEIDEIVTKLSF